jgi:CspA family cold shock protein
LYIGNLPYEVRETELPELFACGIGLQFTFHQEATMATMTGTIKRLTDKGFGFIASGDGSEYFFHQSACSGVRFDELREGQSVTFERGQGPKGPRAENVRVA